MLYLLRRLGESVVINNNIEVKIVEITKNKVKLGVSFPESNSVLRKEVYERAQKENLEALRSFNTSCGDEI